MINERFECEILRASRTRLLQLIETKSFKIGSSPSSWRITPDVNEVKHLLIDTVNRLESDLESRIFVNYVAFELPMGLQVKNHVQALQAANYHEAEHSGKIFTYLKLLVKE